MSWVAKELAIHQYLLKLYPIVVTALDLGRAPLKGARKSELHMYNIVTINSGRKPISKNFRTLPLPARYDPTVSRGKMP